MLPDCLERSPCYAMHRRSARGQAYAFGLRRFPFLRRLRLFLPRSAGVSSPSVPFAAGLTSPVFGDSAAASSVVAGLAAGGATSADAGGTLAVPAVSRGGVGVVASGAVFASFVDTSTTNMSPSSALAAAASNAAFALASAAANAADSSAVVS